MGHVQRVRQVARLPLLLSVCAAVFSGAAPAKPPIVAKVEALQVPVWVERGGVKATVKAGWALYAGDRVTTGGKGRLEITLVGEARAKLGGDADLTLNDPQDPSAIRLNRGALHLIASMSRSAGLTVGEHLHATVAAGQVWSKADTGRDLLVLMDGGLQIRGGGEPQQMTEPNSVLIIPRGGQPQPVIPVADERLAQWVGQTELIRSRPVLSASGIWDVSLGSGYDLDFLQRYACKVQSRGYPSEIYPVREPGKQVWYRVMVRRFLTREDAIEFARLGKSLGSEDAWVLLPQQQQQQSQ